jgi:hypothetical protein
MPADFDKAMKYFNTQISFVSAVGLGFTLVAFNTADPSSPEAQRLYTRKLYGYAAIFFIISILMSFTLGFMVNSPNLCFRVSEDYCEGVLNNWNFDQARITTGFSLFLSFAAMWAAFFLLAAAFMEGVDHDVGVIMLSIIGAVIPGTLLLMGCCFFCWRCWLCIKEARDTSSGTVRREDLPRPSITLPKVCHQTHAGMQTQPGMQTHSGTQTLLGAATQPGTRTLPASVSSQVFTSDHLQ